MVVDTALRARESACGALGAAYGARARAWGGKASTIN